METEHVGYLKKSYWLMIGVLALQSAVFGFVVYADRASARRDQVIEERTAAMVDEIFPEIFQDLASVSRKATEIRQGVKDLKVQVAAVDDHLSDVGRDVNKVSNQVEGVNQSVTGFFQDTKGLIWGHSINPYVLIAMLAVIAASIPACGWLFGRIRHERELRKELVAELGPLDGFSLRLERLHGLLEKIRVAEHPSDASRPELRKLVEDTERLIAETRAELALMSQNPVVDPEPVDRNPENLH
jgi:hypothetical protein